MDQRSVQHLEKEAVLLSVLRQETELQPNFFPATFLDGKKFVEPFWKTAVNVTFFVLILFVTGTFAAESDKVIYGLVFPIRTFEVLYVQVSPVTPPSLCLSEAELSDLISLPYLFVFFFGSTKKRLVDDTKSRINYYI